MKQMNIWILLASLYQMIAASIQVLSPPELLGQFDRVAIRNSYANYGKIPYGTVLAGRVFYFPENDKGCSKFDGKVLDKEGDPDEDISPIVMVEKGSCTFVRKTKNIQELGGAMALITEDRAGINPEHLVMIDDGTGSNIAIPTILISKEDGEKIKKAVIKTEEDNKNPLMRKSFVVLMVDFIMNKPDNRVEYDIWYNSINPKSLNFIHSMRYYNTRLDKNALMTPHILVWKCGTCSKEEFEKNCLQYQGTSYCSPPMVYSSSTISGKHVLRAGHLESCIYSAYASENNAEKWWEYMSYMKENCAGINFTEKCSVDAKKTSGVEDSRLLSCLSKEEEFFSKERQHLMDAHLPYYPAVIINNHIFRGALQPNNVFKAICAGFNSTPDVCFDEEQISRRTGGGISIKTIIGIFIGIVGINILLIYCYRRYSQREMKQEIESQVSSIMAQYMAMSDKNDSGMFTVQSRQVSQP